MDVDMLMKIMVKIFFSFLSYILIRGTYIRAKPRGTCILVQPWKRYQILFCRVFPRRLRKIKFPLNASLKNIEMQLISWRYRCSKAERLSFASNRTVLITASYT